MRFFSAALDIRPFELSQHHLEQICAFYSIGKPVKILPGISDEISHSNFQVFIKTSSGRFTLKFLPAGSEKHATTEFMINRFLVKNHFPTPPMLNGRNRRPYFVVNPYICTSHRYIAGQPAWKKPPNPTLPNICQTLFQLKELLTSLPPEIPRVKQSSFLSTLKSLMRRVEKTPSSREKAFITSSLKLLADEFACLHRVMNRVLLHNNASLQNFLVAHKKTFTLDLGHICEDYEFSDLSRLVLSGYFLEWNDHNPQNMIRYYRSAHGIQKDFMKVLKLLARKDLLVEYMKALEREGSLPPDAYPPNLLKDYTAALRAHKEKAASLFKEITSTNWP